MILRNIRLIFLLELSLRERKAILMASLGSILEFYDFIIFGFMAHYFVHDIFVKFTIDSNDITLIYLIFIAGYITRPLGMNLYSKIAPVKDLRVVDGAISFLLIASTLTLGLIPKSTSSAMEWSSLLIISAARIIQGLACGAEIQAEIDHLKIKLPKNFAYATLGILAGNEIGQFMAILINRLLDYGFTPQQMELYAWRIPFFIGAGLALIVYLIRLSYAEPVREEHCYRSIMPVYKLFSYYPAQTIIAIGLAGIRGAMTFLYLIFIPFALHNFLNYDLFTISRIIVLTSLFGICGAYLLNQFWVFHQAPRQMSICVLLLIPSILLWCLSFHYRVLVIWSIFPLALLSSCFAILVQRVSSGLFPSAVRLSGMIFANQQGFIIGAGLMPLISIVVSHLFLTSYPKTPHHLVFYSGVMIYLLVLAGANLFGLIRLPRYANYTGILRLRQRILAKI